jgi:hypothetical protein
MEGMVWGVTRTLSFAKNSTRHIACIRKKISNKMGRIYVSTILESVTTIRYDGITYLKGIHRKSPNQQCKLEITYKNKRLYFSSSEGTEYGHFTHMNIVATG